MRITAKTILIWSAIIAFIIPPFLFFAIALIKGLSLYETVVAMSDQYSTSRQNLAVCGALGIFPILLLALSWLLLKRFVPSVGNSTIPIWGGLVPIFLVLLWTNLEFWPIFLPSRMYPGFPHGLEFVLGPGLYAPIGMLIGFLVGWLISSRLRGP